MPLGPFPIYRWQLEGWSPFICLGIGRDKNGRTEIKGRIVKTSGEDADTGHLIYAYTRLQDKELTDVPLFVREIDPMVGKYEIATYDLSSDGFRLDPVCISIYVPSPYRPQRDYPEQSGWVVIPLNRDYSQRRSSKRVKIGNARGGKEDRRKTKGRGSDPKENRKVERSSARKSKGSTGKPKGSALIPTQSVHAKRQRPRNEGSNNSKASIEEFVKELTEQWKKGRSR